MAKFEIPEGWMVWALLRLVRKVTTSSVSRCRVPRLVYLAPG